MRIRKEIILFSLVAVVVLAGCTEGTVGPGANGVIITSFAPDVNPTDGGVPVTFVLGLKNAGGVTATAVKAQLVGLSDKWGNFSPAKDTVTDVIPSLAPADPTTNLPGEEASFTWTGTSAPGTTSDTTYDANVRVFYNYITKGTALFRIVNTDYLRTNPSIQPGLVSSDTTGGPLAITYSVRSPIVSSAAKDARIQFEIQNTGGGRVYTGTTPPSSTNLDTLISITVGANQIKSCAGIADGATTAGADDKDTAAGSIKLETNLRLVGGKSKVISCDISIATTTFQDIQTSIQVDYRYMVESASEITVRKALQ